MVLGRIFCKLDYPCILWSCVVFFFCDDTILVGVDEDASLESSSKDEKSIVKVVRLR